MLYKGDFKGPYSYERYMGRIKIRLPPPNIKNRELIDRKKPSNAKADASLFAQKTVWRNISVANSQEDFFHYHKTKVLNVLRDHLDEVKRVKEVFVQFQSIISNELLKRVLAFLEQPGSALDKRPEYT